MDWSESDVRRNRDYFQWKLHATKLRTDVVKAIDLGEFDFVLLDTRARDAFAAKAALQLAEHGFYAKELNVGWKEWTANKHPTHAKKAEGPLCTCSQGAAGTR